MKRHWITAALFGICFGLLAVSIAAAQPYAQSTIRGSDAHLLKAKTLICEPGHRECLRYDLNKFWCCLGHLECAYVAGEMGCRTPLNTKIYEDDDGGTSPPSNSNNAEGNGNSTSSGTTSESDPGQNPMPDQARTKDCPDFIPKGMSVADFPGCF